MSTLHRKALGGTIRPEANFQVALYHIWFSMSSFLLLFGEKRRALYIHAPSKQPFELSVRSGVGFHKCGMILVQMRRKYDARGGEAYPSRNQETRNVSASRERQDHAPQE